MFDWNILRDFGDGLIFPFFKIKCLKQKRYQCDKGGNIKLWRLKKYQKKIQNHEISIEEAEKQIKHNQYEDLGYGAGYLANKINHLAV